MVFERDELPRVCGSDAGPAVLHWLVGHGKLAQAVGHHLRLRGGYNYSQYVSLIYNPQSISLITCSTISLLNCWS